EANREIHAKTTCKEMVEQMKDGLDGFVSGICTAGRITGTGKVLTEHCKGIKVYGLDSEDAAVLSGQKLGAHKIQGLGAAIVPEVLDTDIYDDVITVSNDVAFETSRKVATTNGILGGISAGAAIAGGLEVAKKLGKGKKVLVILPDNGERYLSTPLYQFDEE